MNPPDASVRWAGTAIVLIVLAGAPAAYAGGELLQERPFDGIAPEGLTFDASDGTFWVTSFLDLEIYHYDADFNLLGTLPSPFADAEFLSGIAYNPICDTLFVVDAVNHDLIEMDKSGMPAGDPVPLAVEDVVNPIGGPVLRGMAFHVAGDGGSGSLYVVESVGARIYEFDLAGEAIRAFEHPDDSDGFPGSGAGAPAGGIELIFDAGGAVAGIDLIGEIDGTPVVRRLDPDGNDTGLSISLVETGAGDVGGIARADFVHPVTGDLHAGLFGTNSSGNELFVVDGTLPPLAALDAPACVEAGDSITVSWESGQDYESVVVERNGAVVATLAGTALEFVDGPLAPGVYRYRVHGEEGTLDTAPVACTAVVGAGQVQAWVELGEELRYVFDIAEDGDGNLWLAESERNIHVYDKQLEFVTSLTAPFSGVDDALTGIAYRPDTDTMLLYNATTNEIQEIDLDGAAVGTPVAVALPMEDDEEPGIGAIDFDPAGDGGEGLIYAVELTRAVVYRLDLDGSVLGSFVHPDELAQPTPDPSGIDTYSLGLSLVPESTGGEVDLGGGRALDHRMLRFLRVDGETGAPTGFELPVDDIDNVGSVRYLSLHNTTLDGEPVAFVVSLSPNNNLLLRVDRTPPPVDSLSFLSCAQAGLSEDVEIQFLNHGPYDGITLERDGVLVETLAGDAESYTDAGVPAGRHRYRLTPTLAGVAAEPRECGLRVGVGALLESRFVHPARSPYQMTRDPSDGSFLIASNSQAISENLYRYDANLDFVETIPAPFEPPWLVAAFAIRTGATGSEIWSISWEVPAPWLEEQVFYLTVQDSAGKLLIGPDVIEIPGAGVGVALTYPVAMVWDSESDSFYFLERNTDTFWQMSTTGALLRSFSHPDPPIQDFVFNLGLDFDPVRQSFSATTAGAEEHTITRAIGMTPDGLATGERIFLEESGLNPIYGIARAGSRLWASGSSGGFGLIVELEAADDLAAPEDVACEETDPGIVRIAWQNPERYDELVVRRQGIEIAILDGGSTEVTDTGSGAGPRAFTVAGRLDGDESAPSACSLVVAGNAPTFIRGDVNGNGGIDLVDPLMGLTYMFSAGEAPSCIDALDADDSGATNLVDPLRILLYMFTGGVPPAPPFPRPGADPTGDTLPACE